MPASGADGGEEQELPVVHPGQSGRDADEVADDGHKTPRQRGGHPVVVEVLLALLYLLLVEQTEMAEAAVGKAIDHGPPDVEGSEVVD